MAPLRKDVRLACCGITVPAGTPTDGLTFEMGQWRHAGPCPPSPGPAGPEPTRGAAGPTGAPVATAEPAATDPSSEMVSAPAPGAADIVPVRGGKVKVRTFGFPKSDVQLLADYINPNLTPKELEIYLHESARLGLNPTVQRQIIAVVYNRNDASKRTLSIQLGLSGYQAIAARSGFYGGSDAVEDGPEETTDETSDHGVVKVKHPVWCVATVWREGASHPFVARVRWSERKRMEGNHLSVKWLTNPYTMLEACAERSALRKAFPLQLGGTDSQDEAPVPEAYEPTDRDDGGRPYERDAAPPITASTPPTPGAFHNKEFDAVCAEIQALTEDPATMRDPSVAPRAMMMLNGFLAQKGLNSLHDATVGHLPTLVEFRDVLRRTVGK